MRTEILYSETNETEKVVLSRFQSSLYSQVQQIEKDFAKSDVEKAQTQAQKRLSNTIKNHYLPEEENNDVINNATKELYQTYFHDILLNQFEDLEFCHKLFHKCVFLDNVNEAYKKKVTIAALAFVHKFRKEPKFGLSSQQFKFWVKKALTWLFKRMLPNQNECFFFIQLVGNLSFSMRPDNRGKVRQLIKEQIKEQNKNLILPKKKIEIFDMESDAAAAPSNFSAFHSENVTIWPASAQSNAVYPRVSVESWKYRAKGNLVDLYTWSETNPFDSASCQLTAKPPF